jgi:hypothetical protein
LPLRVQIERAVSSGAGAKNVHRALDASLKRLDTDFVDLYWMHIWDGVTPVEEIVQTLGDLVRAGKIRYYAFSDMPAWFAMKAATIAAERRIPGPIAMQLEYSLVARDVEGEHIPAAREGGMGVMPWSPLAGGFLTGKYKRGDTGDSGRLSGANPFGDSKFVDRNWAILDALNAVAAEIDRPATGRARLGHGSTRHHFDAHWRAHRLASRKQYCRRLNHIERRSDDATQRRKRDDAGIQRFSCAAHDPTHALRGPRCSRLEPLRIRGCSHRSRTMRRVRASSLTAGQIMKANR